MRLLAIGIVVAAIFGGASPAVADRSIETFGSVTTNSERVYVRAAVGRVNVTPGAAPGPAGGRASARDIRCNWLVREGSGDDAPGDYIVVTPSQPGIYWTTCSEFVGGNAIDPPLQPLTATEWPGEPPGAHTADGLIEEAVDSIGLALPNLETSPPNNTTFVNVPTYYAITNNLGGGTATAEVDNNAIWATATAELDHATFDFGDGGEPLVCETLGNLWNPDAGATYEDQPAECPHTYANPGHFATTITLTWNITWQSSEQPNAQLWGQIERSNTHTVTVHELEAVTS
jgi:hypothetical protein